MTLILCIFILIVNNGTFLNLVQQQNVAVVDGLVVVFAIKFHIEKALHYILFLQTHFYNQVLRDTM